jgi:hypothetical protein
MNVIKYKSLVAIVKQKSIFDCKQEFNQLDGIIFNTPNYKVWIGNFRTRIEAERNLVEKKTL